MTKIELLTYSALFTNDLICANIIDVLCKLRKARFYKHDFKRRAKDLHSLRRRYESIANFKVRKFENQFAELNDYISELVSGDIERLRLKILSYVQDEPKDEISQLILIDVLCSISDAQYKFLLNMIKPKYYNEFSYLNMKSISNTNRILINYLVTQKTGVDVTEYAIPIINKLCDVKLAEKLTI